MQNNDDEQAIDGEAKAKPEVIKIGLDLHARQITECRQLDGSTPKPAQKWDLWRLLDQVEEWNKTGIKIYSCYEAGACGYWYHRELVKRGVVNYVVAPRPLENHRRKRQKTDRLDARSLQMVSSELPIGVGALSWITLQLEIRGWERFQNRRQIASYTGLCPGIHNSNGRGREGRINRCGNSVVRYTLIEMVWRLTRWQPDYPPIKKLCAMVSKRAKRRFIVAAARRLAIDLWRLATGRATAQELGLQLPSTMTQKQSV